MENLKIGIKESGFLFIGVPYVLKYCTGGIMNVNSLIP
jgi:hypothetical protein